MTGVNFAYPVTADLAELAPDREVEALLFRHHLRLAYAASEATGRVTARLVEAETGRSARTLPDPVRRRLAELARHNARIAR